MLLHLLTGFISLSQALSLPRDRATPATKDATISFPHDLYCPPSSSTTCGSAPSPLHLQAGTPPSQSYTDAALLSFTLPLPAAQIHSCTLVIPAFVNRTHDAVTVSVLTAMGSEWEVETVDARTAPAEGPLVATSYVDGTSNLAPLDVSGACREADEQGRISIYIRAEGGLVAFWSKESGNPAILRLV